MIRRKNPTDKELLKQIRIEKDHKYGKRFSVYTLYLGDIILTEASYDHENEYINSVQTVKGYQRKGLANFLYDYIEKDLNIKLKPSKYLLKDGKEFWKNRLKNPTDLSFLRLIKITKKILECRFDNDVIVYYIWFRNKKIGYVELIEGSNSVEDIEINEEYRRKGVATYLYNYIEKDLKIKLHPNSIQLEDGEAFWKARLKK